MNDADVAPFLEAYMLANTPEYLLAHILRSPALDSILSTYSISQLQDSIIAADREAETLRDIAKGYVALVGIFKLSMLRPELIEVFRAWPAEKLRWLPAMLVYWDEMRKPTSLDRFTFAKAVSMPDAIRSNSADTKATIIIAP